MRYGQYVGLLVASSCFACGGAAAVAPPAAKNAEMTLEEEEGPVPFTPITVAPDAPPVGPGAVGAIMTLKSLRDTPKTKALPALKPAEAVEVPVAEAITAPFSPDTNRCSLPEKVAKRIRKTKNWAPEGLSELAGKIPVQKVVRTDQANVNVLLHTVTFQDGNASPQKIVITGARTYLALDPTVFIDTTRDQFLYTLDCSGYFNAAVSASGGVSAASIRSEARLALTNKQSAFTARASIFPPVTVALLPDLAPPAMVSALHPRDRLELLYGLHAALPAGASDSGKISSPMLIDVLWTSSQGSGSFQLDGNLSVGGGGSIGVVSIEGGTQTGLGLSRTSKFQSFDTYMINAQVLPPTPVSVPSLRSMIEQAVAASPVVQVLKVVDGNYEVALDLPRRACEGIAWSAEKPGTGHTSIGTAEAKYEDGRGCKFRVAPKSLDVVKNSGGFVLSATNGKLKLAHLVAVGP